MGIFLASRSCYENAYCEIAVGSALTTVAGYSYLTNTTLTCIMDLYSLETSL